MSVFSLPLLVSMDRSSPAELMLLKLERVQIVPELKVENRRNIVAPPEEINSVPARNLIDIRHYQQVIVLYPRNLQKLVEGKPLIRLLNKRILTSLEPSTNLTISQPRLNELEQFPMNGEVVRLW